MIVEIAGQHLVMVDWEDVALAKNWHWTRLPDGSFQNRAQKGHLLHRLIFTRAINCPLKPGVVVKFKNGERNDLRRANLYSPRIGDPQDAD